MFSLQNGNLELLQLGVFRLVFGFYRKNISAGVLYGWSAVVIRAIKRGFYFK